MFKALTPYRFSWPQGHSMESAFAALPFVPCGPTQAKSVGFVPPRGQAHGALVEFFGDHAIAKIKIETRVVPGAVVRKRVDELAEAIQRETGRKPGNKRRRELKDEALLDLLPQAFTRETAAFVWFSKTFGGMVAVGSASAGFLDDAISLIVKAAPDVQVFPLVTEKSPASFMASLLLGGDDADEASFTPGREAVLVSADAQGSTVRFSKHALGGDHVRAHLVGGKVVKALGLDFDDGGTSFTLDDGLHLKKIELEEPPLARSEDDDPFDADSVIATSTLSDVLLSLVADLGGLAKTPEPAAPAPCPDAALSDGRLDPLLPQAVAVVIEHNKASISLVQRHLAIGYNRANRLLEAMEKDGLVSPINIDGYRTILKTENSA